MKRKSRKIWRDRIRRWKTSGLTAKKFVARRRFSASALHYWSWRLRAEARENETGRTSAAPPVVEIVRATGVVSLGEPAGVHDAAPEPFEVVIGERVRIRVPVRFDAEALVRLVAILERR
jgi:hypothetical protein